MFPKCFHFEIVVVILLQLKGTFLCKVYIHTHHASYDNSRLNISFTMQLICKKVVLVIVYKQQRMYLGIIYVNLHTNCS